MTHLPCYVAPTGTYTTGHHLHGCDLATCRGCVACPTHNPHAQEHP